MSKAPQILILAGPNGAGKSTSARLLVNDKTSFVNADDIARELPVTQTSSREFTAGRLALAMIDRLGNERKDFAIETTLASHTLAPRIQELKRSGYQFELIFFCLPTSELAIKRVESRVRMGGHSIPEDIIRRRYVSGLTNFFERYRPIADTWRMYANWDLLDPILVATGSLSNVIRIHDQTIWQVMLGMREEIVGQSVLGEHAEDSSEITGEIARAVTLALAEHQARNNPVAIWADGDVKIVPPR